MSADLINLIQHWGRPRVLTLGDIMLDRYVWGDAERISQEAPVILLRADRREERLGGASSVATMLTHLGADVVLAGVIGQDSDAERVRSIIDGLDIDQTAVLNDDQRPTTVKERYIGRAQQKHPQQMLRVDFESRDDLNAELESKLQHVIIDMIDSVDVILISDYDKGVCTPRLTQAVIQAARRAQKPVLVDPIRCKPNETPHPYEKYRGCTTMTPNRLEASLASGYPLRNSDEALQAARVLLHRYEMDASIITLDKDGMALVMANGFQAILPTRPRQVYDITGAGDMVLCVLGMALAHGCDFTSAIRLANIAGGLEVEKIGVAPVTREEMISDLEQVQRSEQSHDPSVKVQQLAEIKTEIQRLRSHGRRIVFTNGCFDILHAGHVQYLREAKAQGDILVVGLNSDQSVRELKGPTRPITCQSERALVLAALSSVDYVVIFDDHTPLELIERVQPDVLVKGADYRREEVVGAREVESWGGRVHLAGLRRDAALPVRFCGWPVNRTTMKSCERWREVVVEEAEPRVQCVPGQRPGTSVVVRKDSRMKLAVFLPNWVGDVVMATPALRALRQHFAEATIYGIMQPYVADVLYGTDLVNDVILDQKQGWSRGVLPLANRLRQLSIDQAVLFTNSYRTALASWWGACKRRVGYAREGRGWMLTDGLMPLVDANGRFQPSPIIDAYNRLVQQLGTPKPGYQMELATSLDDEDQADRVWKKFEMTIHRPVIALNPGAAFGAAKHWPVHHFVRLARLLVDRLDGQVLVLCGPKERDLAQIIVQQSDRNDVHSLSEERLSLGLTKACIRRADLLITTDSGPRHFAAAFDRPVVSLFGPTHIEWTETYYSKAVHLQHRLPCGPCQLRVCPLRGADHHRCMEELTSEEVLTAALKLLNGTTALKLIMPPPPERRRAS